jgi:hypothetical protein
MLHAQTYDSHASIHDDVTAQKLGFKAGTIEGPTHFSQFEPLAEKIWGTDWFETGCISAHFRNAVFEGEEVQAIFDTPRVNERTASIRMTKRDGTEVLRGTASVGGDGTETALYQRLRELKPLADPVLLRDIKVGMKTPRQTVRMDFDQRMGDLYPFSLREKLKAITEPSQYYSGKNNPWGRPISHSKCSPCYFDIAHPKIDCRFADPWLACTPIRKSGCWAVHSLSATSTSPSARSWRSRGADAPRVFGRTPEYSAVMERWSRRCCSMSRTSRNRTQIIRRSAMSSMDKAGER